MKISALKALDTTMEEREALYITLKGLGNTLDDVHTELLTKLTEYHETSKIMDTCLLDIANIENTSLESSDDSVLKKAWEGFVEIGRTMAMITTAIYRIISGMISGLLETSLILSEVLKNTLEELEDSRELNSGLIGDKYQFYGLTLAGKEVNVANELGRLHSKALSVSDENYISTFNKLIDGAVITDRDSLFELLIKGKELILDKLEMKPLKGKKVWGHIESRIDYITDTYIGNKALAISTKKVKLNNGKTVRPIWENDMVDTVGNLKGRLMASNRAELVDTLEYMMVISDELGKNAKNWDTSFKNTALVKSTIYVDSPTYSGEYHYDGDLVKALVLTTKERQELHDFIYYLGFTITHPGYSFFKHVLSTIIIYNDYAKEHIKK